jgi:hypothetical protein
MEFLSAGKMVELLESWLVDYLEFLKGNLLVAMREIEKD